jgi:threonine/homoserine/homoserine lactone efflux protein
MSSGELLSFFGVAAVLVITPGADMTLVTRNAVRGGRRAGLETIAGIMLGLSAWVALSAAGLAALLTASTSAFTALKVAGAVYLAYLGIQALRAAVRGDSIDEEGGARRAHSPFAEGLLSNLLNPKIAAFFTSFLPQFVDPGEAVLWPSLALGGAFMLMGLVWLVAVASTVASVRGLMSRGRVARAWNALAGTALIALSVRLAVAER